MAETLPTKTHAELGASSADRWMNCAGSVAMTRDLPNPDTSYSREGTAAHSLLERCLAPMVRGQPPLDPFAYVGMAAENDVEITEDMAESVLVAVQAVAVALATEPGTLALETRFSLAALHPPAPMFGTSDIVIFHPRSKILRVMDYKHGVGYAVAARNNPQLRYYALGACLSNRWTAQDVTFVEMTIIQPRAAHPDGVIRSETISYGELHDFAGELLTRADAALAPGAPLTVGGWCRFCRAAAICPAKLKEAEALAQIEFAAPAEAAPPPPETLTMEHLTKVLHLAPMLEAWLRDVRTHVENKLVAGEPVPGYKLVAKRATRRWGDEKLTRAWLDDNGWSPEEYLDQSLKSPAQIEKLVGKKSLPADLVTKESSGYTVVPEYDKRPAAVPGSEFAALPPADSSSSRADD